MADETSHSLAHPAAHLSVPGQDPVHSGSVTAPESNKEEDPLAEALSDIGTWEKTLAIGALTKYDALLQSVEVRRRARPGADVAELAECAAQALRDFIDSIPDPTDKLVTQAALAATKQFEGQTISQRIRDLPGISENVFKRRRRVQFLELVRFLRGYARPATREPARKGSSDDEATSIRYMFASLGRAALTLHFAGVACLFTRIFPAKLAESKAKLELDEKVILTHRESHCIEHMFYSFLQFLVMSDAWNRFPPTSRIEAISYVLTDEIDAKVVSLIGEISELCALAPLGGEVEALPLIYRIVAKHGGQPYHRDLYWDVWSPWYMDNLPINGAAPLGIEQMTTGSRVVGEVTLSDCFDTNYIDEARNFASEALRRHYGHLWTTVIADGKTLSHYAERYFHASAGDLLKRRYYGIIDVN